MWNLTCSSGFLVVLNQAPRFIPRVCKRDIGVFGVHLREDFSLPTLHTEQDKILINGNNSDTRFSRLLHSNEEPSPF